MMALEIFFWLILFLVFWTYAGYYIFLKLLSLVYSRRYTLGEQPPPVSFVITCYNEERRIREKIENTLALDYPQGMMEIIVVSDASTDKTEDIIREYSDRGVQLLRINERHGKHYGQGHGIRVAQAEIIILSDASTFLDPDAALKIARRFADPRIGCVSGWDAMASGEDASQGEGAYVKLEMKLRELESKVGSLVGVSGSFFAVRKSICNEWIDNMSSDFYLPLIARSRGLRAIVEKEAIGRYRVLRDTQKEFTRKVRTVVHGFEVLFRFARVLNPLRFGFFSIQIISHKLLRWMVPFWMILAFPLNWLLLARSPVYAILMAGQILFYILVGLALLLESQSDKPILKIPLFFASVNLSILVAWYKYLTGQEYVVWTATKR